MVTWNVLVICSMLADQAPVPLIRPPARDPSRSACAGYALENIRAALVVLGIMCSPVCLRHSSRPMIPRAAGIVALKELAFLCASVRPDPTVGCVDRVIYGARLSLMIGCSPR